MKRTRPSAPVPLAPSLPAGDAGAPMVHGGAWNSYQPPRQPPVTSVWCFLAPLHLPCRRSRGTPGSWRGLACNSCLPSVTKLVLSAFNCAGDPDAPLVHGGAQPRSAAVQRHHPAAQPGEPAAAGGAGRGAHRLFTGQQLHGVPLGLGWQLNDVRSRGCGSGVPCLLACFARDRF